MEKKEYKFDIISFSGRKESGKTELANICVDEGYEKKSFATALKRLVCRLAGLDSIEELNTYKTRPMDVYVNENTYDILEEETGIPRESIKITLSKLNEQSTARDWLQVVGTDLIRSFDPDWHVRKTMDTLEPGKKYVFDDTRFPNELEKLKEMGAECWYIIRTKTDNINNHESETSINYKMFNYHVIVNNSSLEEYRDGWKFYMKFHEIAAPMREWAIGQLFMNQYVPLDENVLNKLYVYNQFVDFPKTVQQPLTLTQNDTHSGFIEDGGDPFVMENWKQYYIQSA